MRVQDNSGSTKNIFDALDGTDSEGTVTEFVFGVEPEEEKDEAGEGVVFVFGEESEEEKKEKSAPKLSFDDAEEVRPVELSVPEKFKVDERYNVPVSSDEAPRIITTYVPRFTDASLNYKMRDTAASAPEPKKPLPESHEEATREFEGDLDPTAEIDTGESTVSAVVVGRAEPEELKSASTVFKFESGESSSEPVPAPMPEPELSLPIEEEIDAEAVPEEPRVFTIPDPVDEPTEDVDRSVSCDLASQSSLEDAPDGVGDRLPARKSAREYDAFSKRDGFKENFLDNIMSLRVRFFAAAAIAVFALVFECLVAFGIDIAGALGIASLPGAVALLDIQFVVALYLLVLPETVRAFSALFNKKATAELFLSAALAVLVGYTVVIVLSAPIEYPLYGFLYSIYALSAIGAAYFKASSDFIAFKRVSKNGEKLVSDTKLTRTLEHENAALDGMVEEYKSRTVRTFRTLFVPDFFKRVGTPVGRNGNIAVILATSLGVSLVTAVIAYFIPGGWDSAASALALVFLLSCPAFSIMLRTLPAYHAQAAADGEESAIIGEQALFDYAETDVLTFRDTEVFGPEDVSLQRIKLYGHNDNLTKALLQMSALFMNVGGPLDLLFSESLDRKCSAASNVRVYNDGISGEVEGVPVLAGTLEFMKDRGIKILPDTDGRLENPNDSTKVMYAAENGEAYAKFYIRYSFSEEFSMLLPTLDDYGITPLVYTRDPNITSRLITTLTAGVDKIRVLKKTDLASADGVIYNSVSAALVTTGDKNNAINSILIAKKYASLEARFAITELIAMAVGGALATVLSIGGMALVPSAALAAWQAIWCGALHFISKKSLRIDEGR